MTCAVRVQLLPTSAMLIGYDPVPANLYVPMAARFAPLALPHGHECGVERYGLLLNVGCVEVSDSRRTRTLTRRMGHRQLRSVQATDLDHSHDEHHEEYAHQSELHGRRPALGTGPAQ